MLERETQWVMLLRGQVFCWNRPSERCGRRGVRFLDVTLARSGARGSSSRLEPRFLGAFLGSRVEVVREEIARQRVGVCFRVMTHVQRRRAFRPGREATRSCYERRSFRRCTKPRAKG